MPSFTRLLIVSTCLLMSSLLNAKDILRVGIDPTHPPLAYKQDGHLSGIEVAIAEAMGKQMKRDVKFIEKRFDALIPALNAGEIDIIMSGMAITPERSAEVSFSQPYLETGQTAIIRFNDAGRFGFKGAIFRAGAKIAVEQGSAGEAFATQRMQTAVVTRCKNLEEAFSKLQHGDVDFLIHDAPTGWALANDRTKEDLMSLNHTMTEEHLGWAVAKQNSTLLNSINEQLDSMQRSGMLRAIINKWIPVTVELEGQ